MGRKVVTTVYLTEEQDKALRELSDKTKLSLAHFVREGVDSILEKYGIDSYGQLSFDRLLKTDKAKKEPSQE